MGMQPTQMARLTLKEPSKLATSTPPFGRNQLIVISHNEGPSSGGNFAASYPDNSSADRVVVLQAFYLIRSDGHLIAFRVTMKKHPKGLPLLVRARFRKN